MPILLKEQEYGYSNAMIGFPSISACRAILYQSTTGLFGYHQASGFDATRLYQRAEKFARYVRAHAAGPGLGQKLYVGAKIGAGSTYSGGMAGTRQMVQEIGAFAVALNFTGPVLAYDLSTQGRPGNQGVYVQFDRRNDACDMSIKDWTDAVMGAVIGPRASPAGDHVISYPNQNIFTPVTNEILNFNDGGRTTVQPIPVPLR